ncbi:zinc ribbon domain-containing protein [bacterium]|nr:zinc ribbon domain-containing protein [bacterium]
MPIFEYHCDVCTKDSEILVRNRTSKATCPHCGSKRLKKKLSVFAPSKPTTEPAMPACSGNPQSCGRCSA